MPRIINVSNTRLEITENADHYVLLPGEIKEFNSAICQKAREQSVVRDMDGNVETYRIEYVDKVNDEILKASMTFECPMAAVKRCSAEPFKTVEELQAHLENHINSGGPAKAPPRKQ